MARSLSIRIGAPPATWTTLHGGGPSRGRTLSQTRARRQGRMLCGLLPTYQERDPRRRCGEAGAPSPLRFGAAEPGASIGRRPRRLIGAATAPPPPRCAIRPPRVRHLFRRHDGLSSLHLPRRDEGARRVGPPLRCLEPAPAAGARWPRPSTAAARGELAVRNGAARERGRRRSAYEAPNGLVAPGPVSSGAESKRRRCPRSRARQSRVTLLAGPLTRSAR